MSYHRRKFHARTYRLLAKYKQDNNSSSLYLKKGFPINVVHEKKDISNNGKDDSGKKKQPNRCASNIAGDHKPDMKNNTCTFETKKYSHLEKKIFKELDYTDFLKNNRTINNKVYKRIIRKKYGLRIVLPVFLFLFLLIIFILEVVLGSVGKTSLLYVLGLNKDYLKSLSENNGSGSIVELMKNIGEFFKHSTPTSASDQKICEFCDTVTEVSEMCHLGKFFRILIYFVPFIILSISIISGIIYYHKKVKKYEKIKFMKR
ncbi:Plasmodium exported protein (Pm-fam-a like), unknown function [Plasmodium malariae]|uniref:Fam-l protein n=1 Tax=Plasmodium malariae TaxID=5858 RepID=A0A1A8XD28_PLAMA|nr:Plasmodium exported protein (Pm-fam-a like), unknown function [Plasmodium malariae]